MKIRSIPQGYRATSVRGRYYLREWRGQTIVCKWPEPKGNKITARQRDRIEWFQQAAVACKVMDPQALIWAAEASHGTQFLPRDLLYMVMSGRLFGTIVIDGKKYYAMATRNDLSNLLDALGQDDGMLLVRTATGWWGLAPGSAGEALAIDGTSGLPAWQPPSGASAPPGALVTLTSDGTADNSWPKFASFDAAVYDDAGSWSAGTPTRLTVPAGVTHARVGVGARITNETGAQSWYLSIWKNDAAAWDGAPTVNHNADAAGFAEKQDTLWSPIVEVSEGDYFTFRVNVLPSYSGGFLAETWAAIELFP